MQCYIFGHVITPPILKRVTFKTVNKFQITINIPRYSLLCAIDLSFAAFILRLDTLFTFKLRVLVICRAFASWLLSWCKVLITFCFREAIKIKIGKILDFLKQGILIWSLILTIIKKIVIIMNTNLKPYGCRHRRPLGMVWKAISAQNAPLPSQWNIYLWQHWIWSTNVFKPPTHP